MRSGLVRSRLVSVVRGHRAAFPAGKIGPSAENLAHAAGGEHEEWTELYPAFAKFARDEGRTTGKPLLDR
jgi:rubrerythrin